MLVGQRAQFHEHLRTLRGEIEFLGWILVEIVKLWIDRTRGGAVRGNDEVRLEGIAAHGAQHAGARAGVVEERMPGTWSIPLQRRREIVAVDHAAAGQRRPRKAGKRLREVELGADARRDAASDGAGPPENRRDAHAPLPRRGFRTAQEPGGSALFEVWGPEGVV